MYILLWLVVKMLKSPCCITFGYGKIKSGFLEIGSDVLFHDGWGGWGGWARMTIPHRQSVGFPEENAYFAPNHSRKFPVHMKCTIWKQGGVYRARSFFLSLVPGRSGTSL